MRYLREYMNKEEEEKKKKKLCYETNARLFRLREGSRAWIITKMEDVCREERREWT